MTGEPNWIPKRAVFAIHERLLAEHGGAAGVLNEGLLDSALDGPRNQFAYGERDLFRLAASYAYALTQNHPFADGNKRVAFTIAAVFLERNGFRLTAPEPQALQATLALSSEEMDASAFAEWLHDSSSVYPIVREPTIPKVRVVRRTRKKK